MVRSSIFTNWVSSALFFFFRFVNLARSPKSERGLVGGGWDFEHKTGVLLWTEVVGFAHLSQSILTTKLEYVRMKNRLMQGMVQSSAGGGLGSLVTTWSLDPMHCMECSVARCTVFQSTVWTNALWHNAMQVCLHCGHLRSPSDWHSENTQCR